MSAPRWADLEMRNKKKNAIFPRGREESMWPSPRHESQWSPTFDTNSWQPPLKPPPPPFPIHLSPPPPPPAHLFLSPPTPSLSGSLSGLFLLDVAFSLIPPVNLFLPHLHLCSSRLLPFVFKLSLSSLSSSVFLYAGLKKINNNLS